MSAALIKSVVRAAVPVSIRNSRLAQHLKDALIPHNVIYDAEYYDAYVDGPATRSAKTVSASIIAEFLPSSIVDVGCGTGAFLEAFRQHGCSVFGLEYSDVALGYCARRQLPVQKFNLETDPVDETWKFDLAVSVEVAEHLPKRIADRYVDILTSLAPVVVFTAAPPGQSGADHINLQWPPYWIEKFKKNGFQHDVITSASMKDAWQRSGSVEDWYYKNLMIFRAAP